MSIRKAELTDCIDLAALSLQVWLQTYATRGLRNKVSRYALTQFTEQSFQQLLVQPNYSIWVYIKDGHLIGFIAADLKSRFKDETNGYEVTTLYVSEHFQGQGIGKALLEQVKKQHGSPYWLSTWVENQNAVTFYHKLGFALIDRLDFNLDGELHENHVFLCSHS